MFRLVSPASRPMSQYGWQDCPVAVRTQVEDFTSRVAALLAGNLTGVYLHGSLAMGCFNPRRSDIDLLVITHGLPGVETKRELGELLLRTSGAPRPVEISFLARADLSQWRHPALYDFHYSEEWRSAVRRQLDDGSWRRWNDERRRDPDLAAHVTITRQRGICLLGAAIDQVFPVVPAADYLASILWDSQEAMTRPLDAPVSTILNACRVLAFLRAGRVYSKQEGGTWALAVLPADLQPVVQTALAHYGNGPGPGDFAPEDVARFVAFVDGEFARLG